MMNVITQFWSPPEGPDAPFGDAGLIVLDGIRLFIFIIGTGVVLVTPFAMARSHTPGQWVRLGSLGIFAIAAIGTELDHFGDYAHWRLLVHIVGIVSAAWGLWSLFRYEVPATINERTMRRSTETNEEM